MMKINNFHFQIYHDDLSIYLSNNCAFEEEVYEEREDLIDYEEAQGDNNSIDEISDVSLICINA